MTQAVTKALLQVEQCFGKINSMVVASEGMAAAEYDDETGELTDNPYTNLTPLAQHDWYAGYNYWMEHKDGH